MVDFLGGSDGQKNKLIGAICLISFTKVSREYGKAEKRGFVS
ncbi:MAG: hypothetical protein ACI85I_001305 [Arenicella sp.]|jgi:hypothetical protein